VVSLTDPYGSIFGFLDRFTQIKKLKLSRVVVKKEDGNCPQRYLQLVSASRGHRTYW
jgi:hypothetical protein